MNPDDFDLVEHIKEHGLLYAFFAVLGVFIYLIVSLCIDVRK